MARKDGDYDYDVDPEVFLAELTDPSLQAQFRRIMDVPEIVFDPDVIAHFRRLNAIPSPQVEPTPEQIAAEADLDKRTALYVRAKAGSVRVTQDEVRPEFDYEDTANHLGRFDYAKSNLEVHRARENEAEARAGSFLRGALRSLIDLETANADSDPDELFAFQDLQQLTDAFQELLFVSDQELTRVKKPQSRYELESSLIFHAPGEQIHGRVLAPASAYDFQKHATLEFGIKDHEKGQEIQLRFFPERYIPYEKHPHLNGVDPEIAREIIAKQSRSMERASLEVEAAKRHLIEPFFTIGLYKNDPDGNEPPKYITEAGGNWTTRTIQKDKERKKMSGFAMQAAGLSQGAFLPVLEARERETIDRRIFPFNGLVKDLFPLRINYRDPNVLKKT